MSEKLKELMLSNSDVLSRLVSVTWLITFGILFATLEVEPGAPDWVELVFKLFLGLIVVTSFLNLLRVTFLMSILSGCLIALAFFIEMVLKIANGNTLEAIPLLTIVVCIPISGFVAFVLDEDTRRRPKNRTEKDIDI